MVNDIFIDNNITKYFSNPADPEYKHLIEWLRKYDPATIDSCAFLVVSNKLIAEYGRTCATGRSENSIFIILAKLTSEGRLVKISNSQIRDFKNRHFKKKVVRRLRCNRPDRDHIPIVLLSSRKLALTIDHKLAFDINNFPGFTALAATRPCELPYEQ